MRIKGYKWAGHRRRGESASAARFRHCSCWESAHGRPHCRRTPGFPNCPQRRRCAPARERATHRRHGRRNAGRAAGAGVSRRRRNRAHHGDPPPRGQRHRRGTVAAAVRPAGGAGRMADPRVLHLLSGRQHCRARAPHPPPARLRAFWGRRAAGFAARCTEPAESGRRQRPRAVAVAEPAGCRAGVHRPSDRSGTRVDPGKRATDRPLPGQRVRPEPDTA